jgi:rod shape determining protein RodA
LISPLARRPLAVALLSALALGAIGVLTIHSAGLAGPWAPWRGLWLRQIAWLGLGAGVALLAARADLHRLAGRPALLAHGALILLTIAVFSDGVGRGHHGAQRWLVLRGMAVQPSELLKVGLILALASWLRRPPPQGARTARDLAVPAAIVACTVIPVYVQPDLGTALVLGLVAATMLALEPLARGVMGIGVASAGLVAGLVSWGMRPYQRARLVAWLHDGDPSGAGYQAHEAVRVAGAGGLLGRGTGSFAGAEPHPLPEAHGDFALSVWAHEHGLLGTLLVLGLALAIVAAALAVAARAEDALGARVAVGVAALFFWQALFNAGMALGALPVVGVPFPLVSYGGSSTLTCLVGLGLLANVARRRGHVPKGT